VIIDTPGQIEAFSQSASGQIITESLGCTFPTISLYIADTVRCENPNTFMSNMLYSLSILYKSKLPLIVVFNKIDVLDHSFAEKWMKDFDEFDASLSQVDTYLSSLSRSMSLVLEEFYSSILSIGVSALTQKGFDQELLDKFDQAKKEYDEIFLPEVQKKLQESLEQTPQINM
jgi:GTPase SAR1 family protein